MPPRKASSPRGSKAQAGPGKVIVGATMSLDGFVADRNGSVARLYPDLEALRETGALQESIRTTGAVVMGRRAYAMGDRLTFTFVTDGVESAIRQAKAAAGDKNVTVVGGASTFQQCLTAGLADELHIDIMPVLLGEGLRLFESLRAEPIELELIRVAESLRTIELRFRVA